MAVIRSKRPYRYPNGKSRKCGRGVSGGPRVCVTFSSGMFKELRRMARKEKVPFAEMVRRQIEKGMLV